MSGQRSGADGAGARPDPILCALAAWILPGSGHLLLGMRRRGLQYMACILVTFAVGLYLTQGFAVSWESHRLAFVFQVPVGLTTGVGMLLGGSRTGGFGAAIPPDEVVAHMDLGLLFTMVAGLLNVLIVYDACERAVLRRAAP